MTATLPFWWTPGDFLVLFPYLAGTAVALALATIAVDSLALEPADSARKRGVQLAGLSLAIAILPSVAAVGLSPPVPPLFLPLVCAGGLVLGVHILIAGSFLFLDHGSSADRALALAGAVGAFGAPFVSTSYWWAPEAVVLILIAMGVLAFAADIALVGILP